MLMNHNVYQSIEHTFSQALFQSVSISTTAGFTTTSFSEWPLFLPVLLVLSSFIGGCAGSTGGGDIDPPTGYCASQGNNSSYEWIDLVQ